MLFLCFFSLCNVVPSASWVTPINKQANGVKSWIVHEKCTRIWSKCFFSVSLLDILSSSSILPFICWENWRGENKIKFTGTPYLLLGSCQLQCHQGSDKNISKKVKFRETQKEKLTGDHAEPIETKKRTQPSKNVGCPVTFAVKKIYFFQNTKFQLILKAREQIPL